MINDTAKVQAWLDKGEAIPKGTYWIDATISLKPKSYTTLNLEGVELRAIPTDKSAYAILLIKDATDVAVRGGRIIGERKEHKGTTGEAGFGIYIKGNCARITVDGVYIADCWGDGILLSGTSSTQSVDEAIINKCTIYNNRRQGISVGASKGTKITGCTITHTNGTPPECAIDVEPWTGEVVRGITIMGNVLTDNNGSAVVLSAGRGKITGPIRVTANVMRNNKNRLPYVRVSGSLPNADNWLTDVLAFFGSYRKEYTLE